jgi:hypothetical protein
LKNLGSSSILKFKTIESFFKRKQVGAPEINLPLNFNAETSNLKERHFKSQRVEVEEHHYESLIVEAQEIPFKSTTLNVNEVDAFFVERDLGKRPPMWDYQIN